MMLPIMSFKSGLRTVLAGFLFWGAFGLAARAQTGAEPLGPSSRKTGIVITEVMYRPATGWPEFIELYNSNPFFEDVSGYQLDGPIHYSFPEQTLIPGHGFVVVARLPGAVQSRYGLSNVLGGYVGRLQELAPLILRNPAGSILLTVPEAYSDANPFLAAVDFAGHSMVLSRPSLGERSPSAWNASADVGGSPGRSEPEPNEPLRLVRINEIFAPATTNDLGFVELYNSGHQPVDLSGAYLSDVPGLLTNRFRFRPGTLLLPHAYQVLQSAELGFALRPQGGRLYLVNADATRVVEALAYGATLEGVAVGRFPDGAASLSLLQQPTPGSRNGPRYVSDVIINELMFGPMESAQDEFVELYNRSALRVSLRDWRLINGPSFFEFPAETFLAPGGYLVVARNLTNLVSRHAPVLNCTNALGNLAFGLANSGDRLVLQRPVESGLVAVDTVAYQGGGRWGKWSHRGGSTLELVDAHANPQFADNWADSDETSKSPWTTLEATGVLEMGGTYSNSPIDEVELLLLGEGECLVDHVEVIPQPGSANIVLNPDFEGGLTGWTLHGDHVRSTVSTAEGYLSRSSLHVRAGARGDTGANRIRGALRTALQPGQTVTLRARVRWLQGWPEILFRIKGNYLELTGRMRLPTNAGTPGRRNSRAVDNAGPAIAQVQHQPVLPAANEAVVVTARLDDPDGIGSAFLRYRIDPGTNYFTVPMLDDGDGADDAAGDGIYSAPLPGFPAGTLVAFHVEALDQSSPPARTQFPRQTPAHECLVRFGERPVASGFGSYRIWMTQATLDTWSRREVLSNERLDVTFVYDAHRAVYNAGARYAGSPYHQDFDSPIGKPCHYSLDLPGDDQVLGTDTFNKVHAPGNAPFDDPTILTEQTAYGMARALGLPANSKRYVNFFVNGVRRGTLMEDTQVPNGDVVEELFPADTGGDLFKLQPWNEFAGPTSGRMDFTPRAWCTLNRYLTSDGQHRLAGYRWNFLPRSAHITANDYHRLFELIDAANTATNGPYEANLERVCDMEQWMRTFAVEHAAGNWDGFGGVQGQNMYAYCTDKLRWQLLIWDFEVVLGNSASDGPVGDDLFRHNSSDSMLTRLYRQPRYRRAFWRALREIVDGPMVATTVNPLIDAKYAAFQADGLGVAEPSPVKNWLAARRAYLSGLLQGVVAPFAVEQPALFSTSNNLVRLTGTAPVEVQSVRIGEVSYPLQWLTDTNWAVLVPVQARTNGLAVRAYDRRGQWMPNFEQRLTVLYTGPLVSPLERVVLNELHYHPVVGGAGFIELFNTVSNFTFDLSGWTLTGCGLGSPAPQFSFTFAPGTILTNRQFLVVDENWRSFTTSFGNSVSLAGEWTGSISPLGGVVTLAYPEADSAGMTVVDVVRYETGPPWPAGADGGGDSLQLLDPTQDNLRVSNWISEAPSPGAANHLTLAFPPYPRLWLNEVQAKNIHGPVERNGEHDSWLELLSTDADVINLRNYWLANSYTNLLQWRFPDGPRLAPGERLLVWADGEVNETSTNELHTNFKLPPGGGTVVLSRLWNGQPQIVDYLNYPAAPPDASYGNSHDGIPMDRVSFPVASPGASNSLFGRVFINEWMADNRAFLQDPSDDKFDDWLELYNDSEFDVNLSHFTLADASGLVWEIPEGVTLPCRGFLLIWADGDTNATSVAERRLHAPFQLDKEGDTLVLRNYDGIQLDSVVFGAQLEDVSQGRFPDGSTNILTFTQLPTPEWANLQDPFTLVVPRRQTILAGRRVDFTASVRNAPIPPWVLTFGLDEQAPEGAFIEPCLGRFTWMPSNDQVGTNVLTVYARNQVPPRFQLSGRVTIVVQPAPHFIAIERSAEAEIRLRWETLSGRRYRVQAVSHPGREPWEDISGDLQAVGPELMFTDGPPAAPPPDAQRFYRIVTVD
jgi:hypothetical protein